MKVNSVSSYNYRAEKPAFGSTAAMTANVCHKTDFFRADTNWRRLVKFLQEKYENASHVNVWDLACSDGAETWSFLIMLLETVGHDEIDKYSPIHASDISSKYIYKAIVEPCAMSRNDLKHLYEHIDGDFTKYFYLAERNGSIYYDYSLEPKCELKKHVEFKRANMLDVVNNIKTNDNVIFCKNVLMYLQPTEVEDLFRIFSQKLNKSSTIVFGGYEKLYGFTDKFLKYGFKETEVPLVYEKI